MGLSNCTAPILFIVFNRPDTTQRVFDVIRKARPQRLYVAADGPRENKNSDAEKCQTVRDIILGQIDWGCELFTNFREKNLGCKLAVSSGIDWFFKNEEKGIILEDDTLPDFTFFRFCEELLEYYKDNKQVMMISGDNIQLGMNCTEYSYYFSRYTYIWGWASWKRAWSYYDVDMKLWPKIRDNGFLFNMLDNRKEVSYWSDIFEKVYNGKIQTWDYQWLFVCWLQNALNILPGVNLISNIGFGNSGTLPKRKSALANLKSEPVVFPLLHPPKIVRNAFADRRDEKTQFSAHPLYKKIAKKIYGLLNGL